MTKIPVRSRRQAMDWSLVLVSQGITPTIEQEETDGGWYLAVSAQDGQNAIKTLRQYHVENRGWPWHDPLPWSRAMFDWGALVWAILLAMAFWISTVNPSVRDAGITDSTAVAAGQWWRIFTAIMLHADIGHLAANLSIGILLFGLAMGRYGSGTGLLAAYLAGAAGNIASLVLNPKPVYGLGASGMVMGALGLLAAQSLPIGKHAVKSGKRLLVGIAAGVMLFVLYGVAPGTDMAAHLGGFLAGFALGTMLLFMPPKWLQSPVVNFANGALLAALVALTWWLAFTHRVF